MFYFSRLLVILYYVNLIYSHSTKSNKPKANLSLTATSIPSNTSSLGNNDGEEKDDTHDPFSLDPIIIHGNKFFNPRTGEQFFIKGIAYQPSRAAGDSYYADLDGSKFIDPMAQPEICLRDLPYLIDLGVNTVRIYSFDIDKDHDECFKAFEKAGIYVIADLSEPDISVVRGSPTWDVTIFERYKSVVDSLQKYDNLLGFFAGNEVTNDKSNTDASPFVKSSIRDIKNYIKKNKDYRDIPVGYATNDDAETRSSVAEFFSCGDISADFYGINMYEWCGYSTYWTSGYKERTEEFKDFPIPVFFSEFGCNLNRPRPFIEVQALYGKPMTNTWSGGIAYMYFEEPNEFGVIQLNDGLVNKLEDYENLKEQFDLASPSGTTLEDYKKTAKVSKVVQCPIVSESWKASNEIPHSPDTVKCECMEQSLECILSSSVKTPKELIKVFDYTCSIISCDDIKGDGNNGKYGEFSDCSSRQKASYMINEVYKFQGGDKQSCNFTGLAMINPSIATSNQLESSITGNGDTCATVLKNHKIKKLELENESKLKSPSLSKGVSKNSTSKNYTNNAASQKRFYENLTNIVGGIFIPIVLFLSVV